MEVVDNENQQWQLIGFSGEPNTSLRYKLWELMRKLVEDVELEDLGCMGLWYTWERGRDPNRIIRKRLDRALGNREWKYLFPRFSFTNNPIVVFEHNPILVDTEGCKLNRLKGRRRRRFYFESMWPKEEDCDDIISNSWNSGTRGCQHEKLAIVKQHLGTWNKAMFTTSTCKSRS
ncbi:uncharacterized protein LOC111288999 [Durio zibethinus]|uniref:Uncharacterized protein LOC111288999 n=1 Tax=Durio zibethinus TaxID=66656 RepID=A0A6P5Y5B7_DURZI|nr:uncharacterized protein LOC111288999 [Durio zibethinus]